MAKKYKNIIAVIILLLSVTARPYAQVLGVPEIIQEQTNWCWSASTKCILEYYNHPNNQCTIAEYARSVSTSCNPNNYGTTNCCTNPSLGCNQWNYNWGCPGSMQDILIHFGSIQTTPYASTIPTTQIQTEINAGHPFLFRWGWYSGGGHFLVGYGISGSTIYYMNPLPGYGYEIADYSWVVDDGVHAWTHTQTISCDGVNNIWKGTVSTAWETASNWSCGTVPAGTSHVIINPGAPYNPTINSNVTIGTIYINSASLLTVKTGYTLKLLNQ
jgi:hypothetical protein